MGYCSVILWGLGDWGICGGGVFDEIDYTCLLDYWW